MSATSKRQPIKNLREQAEKRVLQTTNDVSGMSSAEIERLVYELQVHQEELEIQNEELRRVQTDLQESNDRYADLYDFAPVGYLTIDANGNILHANLKAATMLGRDRSKIVGARLALYCDPGSRPQLSDHIEQVISGEQGQSCELLFDMPDGTRFDAQLDSNRVAGGAGKKWHCRVIMMDITRRKRNERALIEKDERLRSIADALPVLIAYIDTELRFQFCNATYRQWFGVPAAAIKGQRIHQVLGEQSAPEFEDYLADALSGHRVDFETQLTHQAKGLRHVQVMLVPDTDSDGKVKGIHGLCVDVTERKVVEQQDSRRRHFAEQLVRLSSTEREAYELLVRGKSNKAIAIELDIGLRTAERRRQIILEKLEVETVAELLQQLADILRIEPH